MPLPIPAGVVHRAAALASLIIVAAIGTHDGRAEALTAAPSIEARRSATLPPVARTALAEALAREELAKRRGWRNVAGPPVSFPMPLCTFEGGLCGAVNRDGSVAVEPRFDFVDDFREGRAVVRSAGLYGFVDTDGKVVVEPQYAIVGRYRLGLAEVDIGDKSALIDLDGKQVLEPRFASAIPFTKTVFWVNDGVREQRSLRPGREEFADPTTRMLGNPLRSNGRWGLVDASGAWIRKPEFRDIAGFDPDNENLMWARTDAGWGLIRPDATWALEPTFQSKQDLSDGLAAVWRGGKTGYIDRTGRIAIPLKFDGLFGSSGFAPGMPAVAKSGRLSGLIDRSGHWVVEPAYDGIYPRYGGEPAPSSNLEFSGFYARKGEKTDILDRTGKVVIGGLKLWPGSSSSRGTREGGLVITMMPGQYPMFCADGRIIGFLDWKPWLFERDGTPLDPSPAELWWPLSCDPPYIVKIDGKYGYVDRSMRPLTAQTFDAVGLFHHGLAAVLRDGKYGLLRPDGTWAIEPTFDLAQPLGADTALVKIGGRAMLINATTEASLTQAFDDLCVSEYGLAGAMIEGKGGVIDAAGAWIVPPKYNAFGFGSNYIFGLSTGLLPVRSGERWGFVDVFGKEAIAPQFNAVSRFDRGMAWTENEGEWCPIDRRGNRIATIPCQSTVPINISNPQVFSCRLMPLGMPNVPEGPKDWHGMDRPLIAPKKLD